MKPCSKKKKRTVYIETLQTTENVPKSDQCGVVCLLPECGRQRSPEAYSTVFKRQELASLTLAPLRTDRPLTDVD